MTTHISTWHQATLAQWFVRLSIFKRSKTTNCLPWQPGRKRGGKKRYYLSHLNFSCITFHSVSKLHYHLKMSHFSLLPTSSCLQNSENLSQTQSTPSKLHGHIRVWKEYIGLGPDRSELKLQLQNMLALLLREYYTSFYFIHLLKIVIVALTLHACGKNQKR